MRHDYGPNKNSVLTSSFFMMWVNIFKIGSPFLLQRLVFLNIIAETDNGGSVVESITISVLRVLLLK
jgi:hypothetical protein